jgi:hypothetical protein
MGWAIGSVVGFALLTALVMALARSNTARWERDRRIARAAARAGQPRRRVRAAAWVRAELARRAPRVTAHLPSRRMALHLPHPHLPHVSLHLPHVSFHLPHVRRPHLPRLRVARPWRRDSRG